MKRPSKASHRSVADTVVSHNNGENNNHGSSMIDTFSFDPNVATNASTTSSVSIAQASSSTTPSLKKRSMRRNDVASNGTIRLLRIFTIMGMLGIAIIFVFTKIAKNESIRNESNNKLVEESQLLSKTRKATTAPGTTQEEEKTIHIIFSTDCTPYQHWQSYMLFYSAYDIKQPGSITRIASGCDGTNLNDMIQWHKTYVTPMSSSNNNQQFYIHFTPAFSATEKDGRKVKYEYFNKPFGLLHFLQYFNPNSDGSGISADSVDKEVNLQIEPNLDDSETFLLSPMFKELYNKKENAVIILLDPDQVLLRPMTGDLSSSDILVPGTTDEKTDNVNDLIVRSGRPMAQRYGFGSQWKTLDLKSITGSSASPALSVSKNEANLHYPVGPPYLATVDDMYRIAWYWSTFAPKVHKEYPHLLAEMFAYCIAAAHAKLPHVVFKSLMISDQGISEANEGWGFLKHIPDSEVCSHETIQKWTHISNDFEISEKGHEICPSNLSECHGIHKELPHILHYCQRYMVQQWFFGKRKYNKYFTCDSPILETPPTNLGEIYDYRIRPGDPITDHIPLSRPEAKRAAFMICRMTKAVQDAARYFKKHHCPSDDPNTNLEENLNLFKLFYKNKR